MIYGLFVLVACQLIGELIARALALPLPGPVIGIPILLIWLSVQARFRRSQAGEDAGAIGKAADGLLAYLGLFFVPAGVGVVQYVDKLYTNAAALILALVGSSLLTLIATVLVFLMARRMMQGEAE